MRGYTQPKRLPSPKGAAAVKIKDLTDTSDFFEHFEDENPEDFARLYKDYFDTIYYEVEVETFEDYFNRNPKRFLGELSRLKSNYELIFRLMNWPEEAPDYGWIFLDDKVLCTQLKKAELVEIKANITDQDLTAYFCEMYTAQAMKNLGNTYTIPLKGKKADYASTLTSAIRSGLLPQDIPHLIQPGKKLDSWFSELQIKYVYEIERSLPKNTYPTRFIIEVLQTALSDHYDYPEICSEIKKVLQTDEFLVEKDTISASESAHSTSESIESLFSTSEPRTFHHPHQHTENEAKVRIPLNKNDDEKQHLFEWLCFWAVVALLIIFLTGA